MRRQHAHIIEVVAWILAWLLFSPLVMASIKTLTSNASLNFPYPWMLVGFANFGTWLCCHVLQWMPGLKMSDAEGGAPIPWKYSAVIGVLQGFEVGLGADVIHRISLTLRTEIHMLCPVLMFLFGLAAGIETVELRLMLSIGFVTVGGILACYGTMTWEGMDLVPIALLASGLSGVRWVLTQKWLSPLDEAAKPSAITLALRMSPITALVGFAVAAVREPAAYQGLTHLPHPYQVAALLCTISCGVCLMIVAEMRVVQLTSALLLGFLVPFHNVSVILLDASMNRTRPSGLNWMGIVMCVVASGFYSIARQEDKQKDQLIADSRVAVPAYHSTDITVAMPASSSEAMC